MMALTGIVFSIAFVMVQFSAIAYSPRLVLWFARHTLFHSLRVFVATFIYSLVTLAWVDRGGSGTVPFFSGLLVGITNVLQLVGDRGREVIRDMFQNLDRAPEVE